MEQGPCNGTFENWFFDKSTDTCQQFVYGGCKGNSNRFATESACNYHCKKPGVQKSKSFDMMRFSYSCTKQSNRDLHNRFFPDCPGFGL